MPTGIIMWEIEKKFVSLHFRMGRLLAIDFGRKRCGIAVTDPLRIVATGLATIPTSTLIEFVGSYAAREGVDRIIVGEPRDMHGDPSESTRYLKPAIARLRKALPAIPVEYYDERFTSVLAHRAMIDAGVPKMKRRDKALVDETAATIILNDYLQSKQYNPDK